MFARWRGTTIVGTSRVITLVVGKVYQEPPTVIRYPQSCAYCGNRTDTFYPTDVEVFATTDGTGYMHLCAQCIRRGGYKLCTECKEVYTTDEMCKECYKDVHADCAICGNTRLIGEMYDVDGDYCCEDCTFYCESCERSCIGEQHSTGSITICDSCRNEFYCTCSGCGNLLHYDDANSDDYGDNYCEYCWEEDNYEDLSDDPNIHDALYKPSVFQFHRAVCEVIGAFYLGVELEVDGGYGAANLAGDLKAIPNADDMFYLMEDSSLSSRGLEIATMPCTLSFHREKYPWEPIIRQCLNHDYKSHNTSTCGMHIHASKDRMTTEDKTKLAWFVYQQQANLEILARRKNNRYCRFKNLVDGPTDSLGCSPNKYEALNWGGSQTVEFRLWRGSLRLETILGTLDVTDAILHFVREMEPEQLMDVDKTWATFLDFMDIKNDIYPYGVQYLELLGMFPGSGAESYDEL